ncbi:putative endonuclease [Flavobacterium sp. 28A]|uniref:YraN family protein n=1 Tax=Flavobacterium sp. 28A TaxID=2735895 RepID=UPI0015713F88|nr:YraN family protein [Flavobacterium sp. 28A]NRT14355.1 putative endonuclease [Flavobacterium sp. 28A]
MAAHNDLGKLGEEMAVAFLQKEGYEILDTNWTFQKAEIDIIAKKENILAIVEVKTRSSIAFGLPQDFVSPKKIQLLVKAVDAYVNKKNLDIEVRFDIIAINNEPKKSQSAQKEDKSFVIEHLIDAFYHF